MGKRGRSKISRRIWAVDPFDPKNSSTSAMISMCIKEDRGQTLFALAKRVASQKERPLSECRAVLREMLDTGTLGTFEFDPANGFYFKKWEPGRANKYSVKNVKGR